MFTRYDCHQPWPVRHNCKQGRWVGCVMTDCLWLAEGKILLSFWEKCHRVVVLTLTPFSKIQTYTGAECFDRPSSLAAVAPNQSWGRLWAGSCKLEGFPWHSQPIHVWIFENGVEFGAKRFRQPAEAFAPLEKPGGLPSRVGVESPGPGYQLVPRAGPRHYPLGGGEGHRAESGFLLSESANFLCGIARPKASQSDTSKVGE